MLVARVEHQHVIEPGGKGVGQALHAIAEGKHRRRLLRLLRIAFAFGCAQDLAADEAAVLALDLDQPWESGRHAEPLRVSGIDAGDEGIDGVVEKLRSEAPAHELGDGLVGVRRRAAHERLAQQRQLGAPGEQMGGEKRGRRQRHRYQPSAAQHEALLRRRTGVDALPGDAGFIDEAADQRRGFERAVGAGLGEAAVVAPAADGAARPRRGLDHDHLAAAASQARSRGQAGDAGADDQDFSFDNPVAPLQLFFAP